MSSQYIGIASAVLNLISAVPYVYAIFKGKARPNRVTWVIWTFLAWTLLFASLESGAFATTFWMASSALICTTITMLSFWRGTYEKDYIDIGCFILGMIGVVLWKLTSNASVSVYIGSFVDIIAILPTVRKAWKNPASEPRVAWSLGFIAALLNILAIDAMRLVIIVQPVVVVIWHMMILVPLYFRKRKNLSVV